MSRAVWLLVLPAALWALGRGLALDVDFPIVQLVAFTPYAAAAAALVAVLAVVLRRRVAAVVGLVSAAVLLAAVVPRAISDGGRTEGRSLRIMTVNARNGHASPRAILALTRRERIDVLSVQELTPRLDRALAPAFRHRETRPRFGAEGTGLYARFALRTADAPQTTYAMTAATARLPGGPRVSLLAVHPLSPRVLQTSAWERDLRALPGSVADGPYAILAGDFNATLDHRELRRVLARGYRDAAARAGAGLSPTWPAGRLLPPPVTIDHVLAGERVEVREVSVHDVSGTDHRAVVAELVLPES